jgi:hypothetical protein
VGCLTMIVPGRELSLLDRVEEYLRAYRLAPTRFGKIVVGSPSLVNRMRDGKSLRQVTIDRIEAQLISPPRPMTKGEFKAKRYRIVMQAQILAEMNERDRRASDPHEQAANHLRRRFAPVCRATVHNANASGWYVGTGIVTDEELLQRARTYGWRG